MPFGDGLISSRQLCVGAVTDRVISDGAITIDKFESGLTGIQVVSSLPGTAAQGDMAFLTTNDKLYRYDGSAWTVAVDGSDIEDGTIVASDKIQANSITADEILANTITAGEIAAGTITATELTISSLDAITASMGALTVDDYLTMGTGGVFRTASSGRRIELAESAWDTFSYYSGLAGEVDVASMSIDSLGTLTIEGGTDNVASGSSYIKFFNSGAMQIVGGSDAGTGKNVTIQTVSGGDIVLSPSGQVQNALGSASVPSYSFSTDADTGMYHFGTNAIGFATGGTGRWHISSSGEFRTVAGTTGHPRLAASTSASAPPYSFEGDTNTGMYRYASGIIGFTVGGAVRATIGGGSNTMAIGTAATTGHNYGLFVLTSSGFTGLTVHRDTSTTTNYVQQWTSNVGAASQRQAQVEADGDFYNRNGTYGTISDERLKDDIQPMRSYWDEWKALEFSNWQVPETDERRVGLVAQQTAKVFPKLVKKEAVENEDKGVIDEWRIKSSVIEGPIAGRVLQEAMERIEALETQLKGAAA